MADQQAQIVDSTPDPDKPSTDYGKSIGFWKLVRDVLGGVETMRAISYGGQIGGQAVQLQNVPEQLFNRALGVEALSPYLPKFPNETWEDYDRRRRTAFMTNVYADISSNLASKPFSKTCELAEGTGEDLKKLSENVDGLGNNLHVFARSLFKSALDDGITWILCDYTRVPPGATLADERALGARPYFVHVQADKLLAVYSKFVRGTEIIFLARIDERVTEVVDGEEKVVDRVREFSREPVTDASGVVVDYLPAKWKVYEKIETESAPQLDGKTTKTVTWDVVSDGDVTLGVIPLVPLILGKRDGVTWRVAPPIRDLAYMQVKLFQQESNLDSIKELTAFPMLAGNGITDPNTAGVPGAPPIKVPVGPRGVLFAPPSADGRHGEWRFIEPAGSSLTFLQAEIEKHKTEMRDLGMQPLTAANLTVITTANVSVKAHSAVQAWALGLKNALEVAWTLAAKWLNLMTVTPQVNVHTDFGVDFEGGVELTTLLTAEGQGVLSPVTVREEFKRRGVLSDDFDEDQEQQRLAEHQQGQVLQPEKHIDPRTGMPVVVTPKFGKLSPPPKPIPPALN